jgi:hypothetical protein
VLECLWESTSTDENRDRSGDSGREERQQRENQKANEKYLKVTKGKQRNMMEAFNDTVEVWTENVS